ncbi:pilin [Patescibacteria group bacterium]|nr:pilin [Patescibacteria group bacterium]MBU0964291.1 pilin [Patescibacteria group bacterium]
MKKQAKLFRFITLCTSVLVISLVVVQFAPTTVQAADPSGPSLPNPLGEKDGKTINLLDVMLRVMQIALAAVDIFALFMFILGGFELLISGGNPNMIKKAKDTLIWATIGILVITLSYSILKFLFEEIQKGWG